LIANVALNLAWPHNFQAAIFAVALQPRTAKAITYFAFFISENGFPI
jgi:hypothetical protein